MLWRTRIPAALLTLTALTTALSTAGSGTAIAEPASHQRVLPATDRELSFTVDGTTTYGTVHIPAHRAGHRLAAALLLPGSGPTDRDGNQPPTLTPSTLALVADALGQDGVMTLRFDKYGTGRTGLGQYQHDPSALDLAAFTRQAAAGYDELRAQPEADPHALLIAGHSEGGMQALLVARTVHPAPAGLALLEPQDERFLDIIDYQVAGQLDQAVASGQLPAAQAELNKTGLSRAIAEFRAGRPADTSTLLPGVAALLNALFSPAGARFVRSDDAVYPPDVARGLPRGTRTLVTCGTADTNVPCATTPPLLAALTEAHAAHPGLRVLPGLDHFLHPDGTPVNTQLLAPTALQALHTFVRPWRTVAY